MPFTSEAIKEVESLLQAGRKNQALTYLKNTAKVSSRESRKLIKMLENELASNGGADHTPYVSTAMDGPLKSGLVHMLHKGNKTGAIEYIRQNRKISLTDCLAMIDDVERNLLPHHRPPKQESPLKGITGWILLGTLTTGVIFTCISGYTYYSHSVFIENSDLVDGRVTDLVYSYRSGTAPVIEYEWAGRTRTYTSDISSFNPVYSINEVVSVYVHRQHPDQVIINTFTDRWLTIAVLGFLGFCFIAITLFVGYYLNAG